MPPPFCAAEPPVIMQFIIVGLLLGLLFADKVKTLKKALPFVMIFLFLLVFNFASISGFNPVSSMLQPAETWYIFTLMLASMIAVCWRELGRFLKDKFSRWLNAWVVLAAFIVLVMPFGFWQARDLLNKFEDTNFVCGVPDDSVHRALVKGDFSGIDKAFPVWFEKDEVNWRFFSGHR